MEFTGNQESLIKVYLAAFLRAPEKGGFDYWSGLLSSSSNLKTVINQIFDLPVVREIYPVSGTVVNGSIYGHGSFVTAIYNNVFGKAPDTDGLNFWANRLAQGQGRGELVLDMINAGLALPPSVSGQVYVANRYWAGKFAVMQQATDGGEISPANLRDAMDSVNASASSLTPYSNNITVLSQMAAKKSGVFYTDTDFSESVANDGSIDGSIVIRLIGDTFKGDLGAKLGTVTNMPATLVASLVKSSDVTATLSFTGKATAHAAANSISNLTVRFAAADFTSGSVTNLYGVSRSDLEIDFIDLPASVSGDTLSAEGLVPGVVTINLATDTLTLGSSNITLRSGSMASVVNVDLSKTTTASTTTTTTTTSTATINFTADPPPTSGSATAIANTFTASPVGGTVRAGQGNDTLFGGAGIDRYVFEATAATNGVDTIHNFTVGTGGDVLNLSAFLRTTKTTTLTTQLASSTTPLVWTNGAVLVLEGSAEGTPYTTADIAALFGASLPFVIPTGSSKAVLITADVAGDATVWFITNTSDLLAISSDEVQQVATLVGVNNLGLVPFLAANFA
jgi:hypothetical protein